jgi:spore coat protein CotH
VEVIRSIIENNQPVLESDLLLKTSSLIKALYNAYSSKTEFSKEEKKIVDVDAFQKLYKLAKLQFSANTFKGLIDYLYLVYHFPKLFIYSLARRKK